MYPYAPPYTIMIRRGRRNFLCHDFFTITTSSELYCRRATGYKQ